VLVLLPPPEAGNEAPVVVQTVPLVARAPLGGCVSHPLGYKPPIRLVPCVRCGKILERRTHFIDASCFGCLTDRKKGARSERLKRMRRQARQFRILCHFLGYEPEQFEDLLAEIKASPMCFRRRAETRAAKYDLHTERRAAG
jgi:hypothetical protein